MSTEIKEIIAFVIVALICVVLDFIVLCLVTTLKDKDNAIDEKNEENNDEH